MGDNYIAKQKKKKKKPHKETLDKFVCFQSICSYPVQLLTRCYIPSRTIF